MDIKQLTELGHLLGLFKDNYGQSHPITSDSIDRVLSTIEYIENTEPSLMSVDQIMDKLQMLSQSLINKEITLDQYLTNQKIYEDRLREIANGKHKHEDIFKA